jgi:hypothetical protein
MVQIALASWSNPSRRDATNVVSGQTCVTDGLQRSLGWVALPLTKNRVVVYRDTSIKNRVVVDTCEDGTRYIKPNTLILNRWSLIITCTPHTNELINYFSLH